MLRPASSRMTPSRKPPRPIFSGRPSAAPAASSTVSPAGISSTRSRSIENRCATASAGSRRQHAQRALQRVARRARRRPAAAARRRCRRPPRRRRPAAASRPSKTPWAYSRIACSSAADGRVRRAGSRRSAARSRRGRTPTTSRRRRACRSRARSSRRRRRPRRRCRPAARRACAWRPRTRAAPPPRRRAPRRRRRPRSRSAAVNSAALAASRIAAVATTRSAHAAELLDQRALLGDHRGDLGDLLARDLPALQPLADAREGALLEHLAEPPVRDVGDQHARRVGADVDAGAEHFGEARCCHDGSVTAIEVRGPAQGLRRARGGAGHRLRGPPRRGVRPARPQRGGQDDDRRDPRGLPQPQRRARVRARPRPGAAATPTCARGWGSCCRARASTST